MDGYKLTLASDVLERDGLGLELYSPNGKLMAEVFRDDLSGAWTFNSFMPLSVPLEVLTWFFDESAQRL